MLKIMTPQGLKTVSLSSSAKSATTNQQQQASVLKRNLAPSFSIASSTSPASNVAMANTKSSGGQIQIQIQAPSQHSKHDIGSNIQPSKSGMLRQIKSVSAQPNLLSTTPSKIVPRQQQPSTLQLSSKLSWRIKPLQNNCYYDILINENVIL